MCLIDLDTLQVQVAMAIPEQNAMGSYSSCCSRKRLKRIPSAEEVLVATPLSDRDKSNAANEFMDQMNELFLRIELDRLRARNEIRLAAVPAGIRHYEKPIKRIPSAEEKLKAKPLSESDKSNAANEFMDTMNKLFLRIEFDRLRGRNEMRPAEAYTGIRPYEETVKRIPSAEEILKGKGLSELDKSNVANELIDQMNALFI